MNVTPIAAALAAEYQSLVIANADRQRRSINGASITTRIAGLAIYQAALRGFSAAVDAVVRTLPDDEQKRFLDTVYNR